MYSLPDHQPIHHHLNGVLDILIKRDLLAQLIKISVNADTDIAALLRLREHLLVAPLLAAYHRRKQLQLRLLRQLHDSVHHLVYGLLLYRLAAVRAVRNPDARIEQTHIVINLRHRADRGTRVSVGALLINGDRRGQSLDALHLGFLHLPEEHARVGGQRLHIAPLPLRINCIKGKT